MEKICCQSKRNHAPIRKKFPKIKIITLGIDDLWASVLIVMSNYSKENNGYKYILSVNNTFSKYVWAKPLKKKNGKYVSETFENIILDAKKLAITHQKSAY